MKRGVHRIPATRRVPAIALPKAAARGRQHELDHRKVQASKIALLGARLFDLFL